MKRRTNIFLSSIPFLIVVISLFAIYIKTSFYEGHGRNLTVNKGFLLIPKGSDDEVFLLSGEFYFTPGLFNSLKNSEKENYVSVPGNIKSNIFDGHCGYGSYGLHIEGLNPNLIYAIRVPHAFSSAFILVNGKSMGHQGFVGKNIEEEVPGTKGSQGLFRPNKYGNVDIIFNISNFHFKDFGFLSKIMLGEVSRVGRAFRNDLIFSGSLFATIFTISIFLFLLFFFYKQARFVIWFSLASITIAIRSLFFYPHLGPHIFTNVPWQLSFIIRYSSFPLSIIFFTIFFKRALRLCYRVPYFILLGMSIIYVISVMVLPSYFLVEIVRYYQAFSLFCLLYNVIVIFHAMIKKREYVIWIFFANAILISVGSHDLLVATNYISGMYIAPVGSSLSLIILSIMVLKMYCSSIDKVETLRESAKQIHTSLSRFVPDQIVELLNKASIKDIELGDSIELRMPVLFMDIREFTNISERLTSEETFDFLNKYFAFVVPIVRHYNGIILKYLGDGFFALFPDGASSAAKCAIAIQNALRKSSIVEEDDFSLRAGITLDIDDILLGIVGNAKRMESIVISNSYSMTEKMQMLTKKYDSNIVLSSYIYKELETSLKVFARPIQVAKNSYGANTLIYELYAGDDEKIKLLKTRSQGYLIEAFKNIITRNFNQAYIALQHAIDLFPDDAVAKQYLSLFKK